MGLDGSERGAAEEVGGKSLLSVLVLEGLLPIRRSELEDPSGGPAGQEAQEVPQVADGLDPVELAARQERDKSGVGAACVIVAQEQPVLTTDALTPERVLTGVVVDWQPLVDKEALERGAARAAPDSHPTMDVDVVRRALAVSPQER
jgi:hypothetical protein